MNRIIFARSVGEYLEGGSHQHVKHLPYCFRLIAFIISSKVGNLNFFLNICDFQVTFKQLLTTRNLKADDCCTRSLKAVYSLFLSGSISVIDWQWLLLSSTTPLLDKTANCASKLFCLSFYLLNYSLYLQNTP